MKVKKILILFALLLLPLTLSACSGSALGGNNWAGLSADDSTAYLANGKTVYAVSTENGKMLWQYPEKADAKLLFFAPPALTPDGQLILSSAGKNHALISLNPKTGAENWVASFEDVEDKWIAAPLATEDALYAPNTDGALYVLSLDGSLLWSLHIGGALWTTPVMDGDMLYLSSLDHHVYAVDTQSREVAWSVELDGALPGAPALSEDGGTLYIGSFASKLDAIDTQTHEILWEAPVKGWIWDTPALEDGTLYFGDLKGNLYALSAEDAAPQWGDIRPDGPVIGAPLLLNGHIFFSTESGSVYALDTDGSILWTFPVGGNLYASPVASGETLLVAPSETDFILAALTQDGKEIWTFTPEK